MKEQSHQSEAISPAVLTTLTADPSRHMTDAEQAALERLVRIAKADTGQSRRVAFIARVSKYPDSLGYEADFKAIVRAWRPELAD